MEARTLMPRRCRSLLSNHGQTKKERVKASRKKASRNSFRILISARAPITTRAPPATYRCPAAPLLAPLLTAQAELLRSPSSLPRMLYYLAVPNRSPRTPSCCVIALFSTVLRKSLILGHGLSSDFRRFKLLRSPRPCSRERILFTPLGT